MIWKYFYLKHVLIKYNNVSLTFKNSSYKLMITILYNFNKT